MEIVINGLDVCQVFEWKGNLTDSNPVETGDMYYSYFIELFQLKLQDLSPTHALFNNCNSKFDVFS